jgi:hypothetical protein
VVLPSLAHSSAPEFCACIIEARTSTARPAGAPARPFFVYFLGGAVLEQEQDEVGYHNQTRT